MGKRTMIGCLVICVCTVPMLSAGAGGLLASLDQTGPRLESIGPIAFGPEGILLIADPRAAAVLAVDTGDRAAGPAKRHDVQALDVKVAGMLGASKEEILVNDLALNPISGNAYLSVSRGRGPDAAPVLVRLTPAGQIEMVDLAQARYAKASIWPAPDKDSRGRDVRQDAITEIAYVNDNVVVAGLSNQEFSSRLRVLPFPFTGKDWDTGLEIYHTSHGKWETHSPVRTFTPFVADNEPCILAAHTCTPLVKIPVSALMAEEDKVVGSTIAELGNRNRPLDMLIYNKADKDYLLITNSSRGVMKLAMADLPGQQSLTAPVDGKAGVAAEQIAEFEGMLQVEPWGDGKAVALRQNSNGTLDLQTVALP